MNRRIEVPIWLVAISASLNVLFVVGLVIGLITGNGVSLIKPTLTPTATATATATVAPTKTLTPTASPTRPPTATPVPCKADEVSGVDCAIDVGGLAVTVVSQERSKTFIDGNGQEWQPKNDVEEFMVVHLTLPPWTIKDDLVTWFEDGGLHDAPMLIDSEGKVYSYSFAWVEETEGVFGVAVNFVVPKDASGLILIIQPGDEVDLSLVPDLTVADAATQPTASQSGGQAAEPTDAP